MFVFKMKVSKKSRITAIVSVAGLALAVLCISAMLSIFRGTVPDSAVCDSIGEYSLMAEEKTDRLSFFEQLSLKPVIDSEVADTVVIPDEFDEVYTEYNQLQKKCGLDLEKFKGREVSRYKYKLSDSRADYAVLLVCNGRAIGGHLSNGEYGGELLPLI